MTDFTNLQRLLDAHSLAQSDLNALEEFIAKGGEHRLTVNVELPDGPTKEAVERVLSDIVNKPGLLETVRRRQAAKVDAAANEVAITGMAFGIQREVQQDMKAAAE